MLFPIHHCPAHSCLGFCGHFIRSAYLTVTPLSVCDPACIFFQSLPGAVLTDKKMERERERETETETETDRQTDRKLTSANVSRQVGDTAAMVFTEMEQIHRESYKCLI